MSVATPLSAATPMSARSAHSLYSPYSAGMAMSPRECDAERWPPATGADGASTAVGGSGGRPVNVKVRQVVTRTVTYEYRGAAAAAASRETSKFGPAKAPVVVVEPVPACKRRKVESEE